MLKALKIIANIFLTIMIGGIILFVAPRIYYFVFYTGEIIKEYPGKEIRLKPQEILVCKYGEDEGKVGQERLEGPYNFNFDNEKNIYIADTYNHRIQKFDKNGNFLMSFGKKGKEEGEFIHPYDIYINFNNEIYVRDAKRIQKFDKNGNFLSTITKPYSKEWPFLKGFEDKGYVYEDEEDVKVDTWGYRKRLYDFEKKIVRMGMIPLMSDGKGSWYVLSDDDVKIYNSQGVLVKTIELKDKIRNGDRIVGVDSHGNIYFHRPDPIWGGKSDSRLMKYDPAGKLIGIFRITRAHILFIYDRHLRIGFYGEIYRMRGKGEGKFWIEKFQTQ